MFFWDGICSKHGPCTPRTPKITAATQPPSSVKPRSFRQAAFFLLGLRFNCKSVLDSRPTTVTLFIPGEYYSCLSKQGTLGLNTDMKKVLVLMDRAIRITGIPGTLLLLLLLLFLLLLFSHQLIAKTSSPISPKTKNAPPPQILEWRIDALTPFGRF